VRADSDPPPPSPPLRWLRRITHLSSLFGDAEDIYFNMTFALCSKGCYQARFPVRKYPSSKPSTLSSGRLVLLRYRRGASFVPESALGPLCDLKRAFQIRTSIAKPGTRLWDTRSFSTRILTTRKLSNSTDNAISCLQYLYQKVHLVAKGLTNKSSKIF